MFDTYITVTGVALNAPERRTTKTNQLVASFRVASHPRRFDKNASEWVDAPSLRIRVTCWRRLADHVAASVNTGDPVVVHGRISTRDWVNEQGEPRISYELEAVSVGHDLNRGLTTFTKARPEPAGAVVEEPDDGSVALPGRDEYALLETGPDTADAMAILAEAGLTVPEPGEEDEVDEDEVSAQAGRGRRRARQPVPA
jgi:single-strand DNA-binding protein